jgi:hypothetical protein
LNDNASSLHCRAKRTLTWSLHRVDLWIFPHPRGL